MLTQLDLNDREGEIIGLLSEGLMNKEIAQRTGLTLYTVKWYLKQIYSKLQVSNRTQAVARARELGLLSGDEHPVTASPSNVPAALTTFFGREAELERLREWLTDDLTRLVTIHGMGGMGKTRLALQAAHGFRPVFPDGVYWVSLADADADVDPLLRLLVAFDLTFERSLSSVDVLSQHLKTRHCLIVLDNFENHLPFVGQLVALLQSTERLRLLVTSRELLNVSAETVLTLTGMAIPDAGDTPMDNGAFQLYVERMRAVRPDYEPDEADQREIIHVCHLVEGMPLALELAAGWGHMLSVAETRQRIEANADILSTDQLDRPTRQRSIRATFDYSWQMLEPSMQQTLLALSIFRESFTFRAAESVAQATLLDLKRLLDCALLQHASDDRFTMHPLIRQYTAVMLADDPATYEAVSFRHGEYFLNFVMEAIETLYQPYDKQLLRDFDREKQNLGKAWTYALAEKRYDWVEVAAEVGYICDMAWLWEETDGLFAYTLGKIPADHLLLRGRLLAFRAIFAFRRGDLVALQRFTDEAWELLHDSPYRQDALAALAYLTVARALIGDLETAHALEARCQALLDDSDLVLNQYMTLITRAVPGMLRFAEGDYEAAIPLLDAAPGEIWNVIKIHQGEAYIELGRIDEARRFMERFYENSLTIGDYMSAVAGAYYVHKLNTAPDELVNGLLQEYRELARLSGNLKRIVMIIEHFASVLLARGKRQSSGEIFLAGLHLLSEAGRRADLHAAILDIAGRMTPFDVPAAAALYHAVDGEWSQEHQRLARENRQMLGVPVSDAAPQPLMTTVAAALLVES